MSDGVGKAVVGVVAVGTTYVFALAMAEIAMFAIIATIAAVIVGAVVIIVALVSWSRWLAIACAQGDWGWLRDLILAPAAATLLVIFFDNKVAAVIRDFLASNAAADGNNFLSHGSGLVVALVAGPGCFILFLAALINTPKLLGRQDAWRLLAYPAYGFFALYLGALAITMSNGWDTPSGARQAVHNSAIGQASQRAPLFR